MTDNTEYMYDTLRGEWMGESFGRPFASDVYSDRSLILEFSDRRADWRSVVPPRFSEASLDTLTGLWAKAVENWLTELSSGPVGLSMIGENGVGKTHAAVAACRYVSLHGVLRSADTLYRPRVGLLECVDAHNVLDSWSRSQDAHARTAFFKSVPLLILDDLGSIATTSQATVANIVSIVNSRYNEKKPTVVTSNLDVDALTEMYGSTMVRRVINDETVLARQ